MMATGSGRKEGSRQITLARNAGQLRLSPDAQGFDFCLAVLLTRGEADIGRLTRNLTFDVPKRGDTVEGLACDLGFIRGQDIVEVASPVCPAGCFTEAGCPIPSRVIQLAIAFVAISLKDAPCLFEVPVDVLFRPSFQSGAK